MRSPTRARLSAPAALFALLGAACLTGGCGEEQDSATTAEARAREVKSSAALRATRRAFDGAPPIIPHDDFGAACISCHDAQGLAIEGVGFAPPSPHEKTAGMSSISRCRQCHVPRTTEELFVASTFEGLAQDLRHGARGQPLAPPVMPHPKLLRENCVACHSGPAAREEIRTDHPERQNCAQCHVPRVDSGVFARR